MDIVKAIGTLVGSAFILVVGGWVIYYLLQSLPR
jgi:hypothetical protein